MLALLLSASPASGQAAPVDTTPLSFQGITAGARLVQVSQAVRRRGSSGLRCVRAERDSSVQECRAAYRDSTASVNLWLSAMDSASGIITLQTSGNQATLVRWQADLERRYGQVPVQVQGSQRMRQWVRRGRMIRLTWRQEGSGLTMSVSLVDGRVLDGWGARSNAQH